MENEPRKAFLDALAALPEEAFGWLIAAFIRDDQIWPKQRGGFMPQSREAMTRVETEARNYVE